MGTVCLFRQRHVHPETDNYHSLQKGYPCPGVPSRPNVWTSGRPEARVPLHLGTPFVWGEFELHSGLIQFLRRSFAKPLLTDDATT